ncbi:hypothetical protein [Roseimicrobium sp. ORNL1]|uniref:hypothetical protein n=1 Tax=Roseimicrobium sp. ORNL1 TaxID=2711231 RepID=UPI0013E1B858|nr:hypothetical protein [Roseimicrobium sp. ORNL1]QIF00996.1 hypothetical protein G5S37_05510 [Roseimicrobium sp. ORNL1]
MEATRHFLTRVTSLGLLSLLLMLAGTSCSSKPVWKPMQRPDHAERLTRGCIFYMDGAGGGTDKSNYAAGVVSGMLDAGYPGAGELVAWETGKGLMADQKASVKYKRARAKEAAEKIRDYRDDHPEAPVGILGFSAGTAEAVFALESLSEDEEVHHVVLLGASISRDYDLTKALKRVKHKMHVITSPHDHMLGTLMPLSGTADRKYHDRGAGIKGFILPRDATEETRQLYEEKIVTIPYTKDFRKDGDKGHHFDNVKEDFIRDHVAPLLMGETVAQQ